MTERERLIKLIKQKQDGGSKYEGHIMHETKCSNAELADYLLVNGVTLNRTWIPVDKALPITDGCFEVTIKDSKGKRRVDIANFNKNANFNKWSCDNVIAWRERDKPYGY